MHQGINGTILGTPDHLESLCFMSVTCDFRYIEFMRSLQRATKGVVL